MRKLLLILDFLLCLSLSTSHTSFLPGESKNARQHRKEPNLKDPSEDSTAFESDSILTSERANKLAKEILGGNRKRRQTVQTTKLWPNGIIVYKYDDNWPNSKLGNLSKRSMEKAMKMWQDKTCVKFFRQTPTTPRIGSYGSGVNIIFGQMCQTIAGRSAYGFGDLEVDENCADNPGNLAHLLGHVLGIFHQHNRPDRDKYITVMFEALKQDAWKYFIQANENHTGQLNKPYDIGSIMHLGGHMFNKYNLTIQPKDKRLMAVMGQRTHLSFLDIQKVNDLYTCNRNCPRGTKCKNEGYIGPNCSCTCPLDLTGRKCQKVVQSFSGCGGVLKRSSGTFSSPGYPQKYPNSTRCTWLIQGTAGSSISLKFTSFEIGEDADCYYEFIEVKTYGLTLEGPRFCGSIAPKEIRYNGSTLLVNFNSNHLYNTSNHGFQAQYTIH